MIFKFVFVYAHTVTCVLIYHKTVSWFYKQIITKIISNYYPVNRFAKAQIYGYIRYPDCINYWYLD